MSRLVVTDFPATLGVAIAMVMLVLVMLSSENVAAIMNLTCQPSTPDTQKFQSWYRCVISSTVQDMLKSNNSGADPSFASAYSTCGRSPMVICQLPPITITNESN